jgi:hypothetical protein
VIDYDKLKTKDHQEALAAEIKDLFNDEDLVVVNVSQGWQPIQDKDDRSDSVQATRDRIQSVIEDLKDHVLFVAPRGRTAMVSPASTSTPIVASIRLV